MNSVQQFQRSRRRSLSQSKAWVCIMVDFICIVLVERHETQSKRELQNENSFPHLDSNLQPLVYLSDTIYFLIHDKISGS